MSTMMQKLAQLEVKTKAQALDIQRKARHHQTKHTHTHTIECYLSNQKEQHPLHNNHIPILCHIVQLETCIRNHKLKLHTQIMQS